MDVNQVILNFLSENKGYLIAYIIFMLAYPISSVLLPKYYGEVVEQLKSDQNPNFKVVVFILLFTTVMYTILDYIDAVFMPKLQAYVRTHIVSTILEKYKNNHEEQELGKLISKIVKFPMVVRNLVDTFRNYIVPLVLVLIGIVIRYTIIDKRLGAFALSGILISFLIIIPKFCQCLNTSLESDDVADDVNEDVSEIFDNLMDIYSMNTTKKELDNLDKREQEVINKYKITYDCSNLLKMITNFLSIIVFFGIIVYAYQLFRKKQLDVVGMVNITITGMFVISKIGSLAAQIPDLIFNLGTYIHTRNYLGNLDLDIHNKENFDVKDGKLSFDNININYGNKHVLKNFNLQVNPGQSVAIIGKIGSGKSSLVKALLKLIPYEGTIKVDDLDIAEYDPNAVRGKILYVRQNPIPFNRSLYDNIIYGNDYVTKETVIDMFKKYDLNSFFEHKLDDKVGKKGGKLSGGQRQMIFLLRVLLSKNPVIILDEPTSSLDEKSAAYVWKLLEEILKNRTVLLITHDPKLGKLCNKQINITDHINSNLKQ